MDKPRVKDVVSATGISKAYVSDILSGRQAPSLRAAAHIFSKVGWKHPIIAEMPDDAVLALAKAQPWEAAA